MKKNLKRPLFWDERSTIFLTTFSQKTSIKVSSFHIFCLFVCIFFFCRHVVNVDKIFSHAPSVGAPLTPELSFTSICDLVMDFLFVVPATILWIFFFFCYFLNHQTSGLDVAIYKLDQMSVWYRKRGIHHLLFVHVSISWILYYFFCDCFSYLNFIMFWISYWPRMVSAVLSRQCGW